MIMQNADKLNATTLVTHFDQPLKFNHIFGECILSNARKPLSPHWVQRIFHMHDPITLTQWSIDIWVHYAVTKQRKCALLEHSHPNMYMSWRLNIVWRKQWCTQEIINHPLYFHSLNSNFNRTNISCMISFQSPSNDIQVYSFPIFPFCSLQVLLIHSVK